MVLLAFAGSSIQLVPDGTLLFHFILVIVMVGLLNMTLLKPINRILEERERRTKGRFSEAEGVLANVNEKLADYEARMREARAASYRLLEGERSAASQERERRVGEVKTEAMARIEEEKSALHASQEQAKVSLARQAEAHAREIGGQILGRRVG